MVEKKSGFDLKTLSVYYRYFLPFLGALGASLVMAVIVFSTVSRILLLWSDVDDREKELADWNKRLVKLEELSQGELAQMKKTIGPALPTQKPVFESLAAIKAAAGEAEVAIVDFSSSPGSLATESARFQARSTSRTTKEVEQYEEMKVTMEIEGSFGGLGLFIEGLRGMSPLIDLSTLRITARAYDVAEESQEFKGEIDLSVYYMPDPKLKANSYEVVELTNNQREVYNRLSQFRAFSETGEEIEVN